ncbi:hypothetical protein COU60_00125 [Candidatus Pacearchaeota archaeon CG10_big_fil_rev_8_21_14_0_10_34_76]|nr:MAG: hypothetical protein COU60_00125 [Candidatus Pacearchaeota archaeon CG10_big_fil_rev_8_21_14_0_10_34_76]
MRFQIGKAGVTDGVIESLILAFKNNKSVRISALKGSGRDREKIKEMAEEMAERLPGEYKFKVIGFTIIMRRSNIKK